MAIPVLNVWVIAAPGTQLFPLGPSGATVAEDILTHAKLSDSLTSHKEIDRDVRRALVYLQHRFPGRLRVTWVNPWSLFGLWFCWRHRVRRIPSLMLPDGHLIDLRQVDLTALRDTIAAYLAGEPFNSQGVGA